ncbi:hypothetical protein HNP52_001471 [Sphingomonas kyeonggiensis]|uniref:Uncharacterized protein n=1 Tax=Sphingomonas kyeonggiensis TaxID=1268553 RepID=A0A7W7K126_9SPHN|nr:hypothetical protein [Sphingomonas kyeonggiensis]MBB4838420.1 hypothetical protein [Sphingomonas kyeonggiensis]
MAIALRIAGLVLLLVGAAPPQDGARQARLMDRIERMLVLPKGAQPFARYGRNYALAAPDTVRAVYIVPPSPSTSTACTVVLPGDRSRPCSRAEIAEMAREENAAIAGQARAGQRRWYAKASSLPLVDDGGCTVVTIEYSISRNRILSTACNGVG